MHTLLCLQVSSDQFPTEIKTLNWVGVTVQVKVISNIMNRIYPVQLYHALALDRF